MTAPLMSFRNTHCARRSAVSACVQVVLLLGVLTIVAPDALAAGNDGAATSAYIRADYRLVRAGVSRIHAVEATLHGVLDRVRAECPMAAAGSPQDSESTELSNEVIGNMVVAVVAQDRPAGHAFVTAAGGLSRRNRALTRTIHSYVSKVAMLVALTPPNVCADLHSWTASGFRALPASTRSFAPRFMSAWVGLGELPSALDAYETPGDRQLANRTSDLEARFSDLEAREVETYGRIMNALALLP